MNEDLQVLVESETQLMVLDLLAPNESFYVNDEETYNKAQKLHPNQRFALVKHKYKVEILQDVEFEEVIVTFF